MSNHDTAEAIGGLLRLAGERDASDLHLCTGRPPYLRQDGDMVVLPDADPLTAEDCRAMILAVMPERNRAEYEELSDTDFSCQLEGLGRFRVNAFVDQHGPAAVFRFIPSYVPSLTDLGLPAILADICQLSRGLVLVTGPTGSGKSTTLAAMVRHVSEKLPAHIITIEDPVEFLHESGRSLVNQREVKAHTRGFAPALRAALREDPDIVLIGEMRDLETVEIALETAETGHLVFGTLHTSTAADTVDRLIGQFPADRQNQIRMMLAGSLKAVIAQTLCRRATGGRIAVSEILLVNNPVSALIREGKTFQIPTAMQTGRKQGMRLLNDELLRLVQSGELEPEEAYIHAADRSDMKQKLSVWAAGRGGSPRPESAPTPSTRGAAAGMPAAPPSPPPVPPPAPAPTPEAPAAAQEPAEPANGRHYRIELKRKAPDADSEAAARIESYRRQLSVNPDAITEMNNLAWILATHPSETVRDGRESLKLAKRAYHLSGDDARILDTLAAAQAEMGEFSEAVATASRGIEVALAQGKPMIAAGIRKRVAEYAAGRPVRRAELEEQAALNPA